MLAETEQPLTSLAQVVAHRGACAHLSEHTPATDTRVITAQIFTVVAHESFWLKICLSTVERRAHARQVAMG